MCFFFQAEDGIRYLVRSRGLGDVYKRQAQPHYQVTLEDPLWYALYLPLARWVQRISDIVGPVSYTHLTLPTSDLV